MTDNGYYMLFQNKNEACKYITMSLSDIFTPMQFTGRIDLEPNQLDTNMYKTIQSLAKKKYSGTCIPHVGYIKPGSLKIIKKQIGTYQGTHFTGNMTFNLQLSGLVTRPYKGMIIDAIVTHKTDAGLSARNSRLPYDLCIPKMPNDENKDLIDRVSKNSHIRVEICASELNAPDTDTSRPEYWVVCKLSEINLTSIRKLDMPCVLQYGDLVAVTKNYGGIEDDRNELAENYDNLHEAKSLIEEMNISYAKAISKADISILDNDIVLQSELIYFNRGCVLGYILNNHAESGFSNVVTVQVLYVIGQSDYKKRFPIGKEVTVNVKKDYYYVDNLLILSDLKSDILSTSAIDIWTSHIKYVVNPYEMIHIPGKYRRQLEKFKNVRRELNIPVKNHHVVNRAYFKMIELIKLVMDKDTGPMQIACIAESPGGFIQALIDYRTRSRDKSLIDNPIYDSITGMSISISEGESVWGKLVDKLKDYEQVIINQNEATVISLEQMTSTIVQLIEGDKGNILKEESRQEYYKLFANEKAELVTGDGGIFRDKSASDTEEMDTSKLVIAEILIALNIQKPGGSFIVKIFDMATYVTVGCLSLLSYCYDEVFVYKPKTSRNASSEKYIVCKGYNLSQEELNIIGPKLDNILSNTLDSETFLAKILVQEDEQIIETVTQYNSIYMIKQGDFIRTGRDYAHQYITNIGNTDFQANTILSYTETQNANKAEFDTEYF
uniref:Ribosomal RNA methyltransferase FtsJ domain-containing protein n=1 Tax=viral metagenome TaxID=1070528 RepID=A0A6C0J4N8_9ZZZZ